jgi:hypothetical protein
MQLSNIFPEIIKDRTSASNKGQLNLRNWYLIKIVAEFLIGIKVTVYSTYQLPTYVQ